MCEQAGGGGGDAKQGSGDAALYDIGLWWIVHNNKMVVAGFEPTCRGRELGIRPVFLDKSVHTRMDTSVHTRTLHSMRQRVREREYQSYSQDTDNEEMF